jgi:hypothetical protein
LDRWTTVRDFDVVDEPVAFDAESPGFSRVAFTTEYTTTAHATSAMGASQRAGLRRRRMRSGGA